MGYAIIAIIAFASGITLGYYLYYDKRKKLDSDRIELHKKREELVNLKETLNQKEIELKTWTEKIQDAQNKVVSFDELMEENKIIKRDLQNLDVLCHKLKLDHNNQQKRQEDIGRKSDELSQRYLKENIKWISSKLSSNNYVKSKERLLKVIELCRGIGFEIPNNQENQLLVDLKEEYEKVLRAEFERQEQERIKAQIREEQKLEREIQRELEQLERERTAIQVALEKALQETEDKHSEEIERLRTRLKEAEEKSQRAISRAQMTKSGHVYVISNIGSFGTDVYKIGMTRRLEPEQRVKELSSASVPFPYDIHMMISSDDAPSLENNLHKALNKNRLNKINLRKEFFKTDINMIKSIVQENHGEISYVADAEALEYYESQQITDEDYEFIEKAYDSLEDEENKETID